MTGKKKKLGIIQSRGLGDILIALPIAQHYHQQGYQIYWPICEQFWPAVNQHVTWIHWIPVPTDDQGDFFYKEPMARLKNLKIPEDQILCLYQSLNIRPDLSQTAYFQIQHFDEFKYTRAGVPFLKKWTLKQCYTAIEANQNKLKDLLNLNPGDLYYITHLEGSDCRANPDLTQLPQEWRRIDINNSYSNEFSPFDWIPIIESAQAIICLDSAISNMIDQLMIDVDKYWIPRSHIHQTPTLGSTWTILDPLPNSGAAQKIFGAQ